MKRLNQRGLIGYTYAQRPLATEKVYQRDIYTSMEKTPMRNTDIAGSGLMDMVRGLYDKIPKSYTDVLNVIPASDDTGRPAYEGEKHAILKLPNGRMGVANFMGPGTNVLGRLKRGDPPRTLSDKTAQAHDVRYALNQQIEDTKERQKQTRIADEKMVNALTKIGNQKTDSAWNVAIGKRLIQAKMKAEDFGLLDKDKFVQPAQKKKLSNDEKLYLMTKETELNQQGYGLPGSALKKKLYKKYKGKGLTPAGGGLTPAGGGLNPAGGFWFLAPLVALIGEAIGGVTAAGVGSAIATGAASAAAGVATKKILGGGVKEVAKSVAMKIRDVVPKITPNMLPEGVKKGAETALKLISTLKSDKTRKEKIMDVAKTLLPHVKKIVHKVVSKKMGKSGSGLKLAGQGMDNKILSVVEKKL